MANKTIFDATISELTTPASGDVLAIVDVSDATHSAEGTSKRITRANFLAAALTAWEAKTAPSGTVLGTSDSQTVTNKAIDGDDNTLTDIPAANLKIASQAQGDILYASSASVWTRLGAGTNGQFLKTQGAGANPTWATPSAPSATQNATAGGISTASATFVDVTNATLTIAPTATFTAHVVCTGHFYNASAAQMYFQLLRGSTVISSVYELDVNANMASQRISLALSCVDAAVASGSTTYKLQVKTSAGTVVVENVNLSVLYF